MTYSLNILHSPSSVTQSEHCCESLEFCLSERFGENICNIIVCGNVLHVDIAVLNGLANEMTNIDMFGPHMEFVVLHERDSTLVVAVKGCWIFKW